MPVSTEDRVLTAMIELLRRQGYAATGIKQLAEAADAPVGSIYHHFRGGKAAVAAAALQRAGAAYIELLPLLMDPFDDLVAGVGAAFSAAAEDLEQTGWVNMCPVGTVAGEVADVELVLREAAAAVVEDWVERGRAYLEGRGLPERDARSLIQAVLSALEGGFVLARTLRSTEPLLAAGAAVAAYAAQLGQPTTNLAG